MVVMRSFPYGFIIAWVQLGRTVVGDEIYARDLQPGDSIFTVLAGKYSLKFFAGIYYGVQSWSHS